MSNEQLEIMKNALREANVRKQVLNAAAELKGSDMPIEQVANELIKAMIPEDDDEINELLFREQQMNMRVDQFLDWIGLTARKDVRSVKEETKANCCIRHENRGVIHFWIRKDYYRENPIMKKFMGLIQEQCDGRTVHHKAMNKKVRLTCKFVDINNGAPGKDKQMGLEVRWTPVGEY